MSARVPTVEEFTALEARVAELEARLAAVGSSVQPEFLPILKTAELMRCKRQRIDDLLSAGRLERVKDGARTLIRRDELERYLENGINRKRGAT